MITASQRYRLFRREIPFWTIDVSTPSETPQRKTPDSVRNLAFSIERRVDFNTSVALSSDVLFAGLLLQRRLLIARFGTGRWKRRHPSPNLFKLGGCHDERPRLPPYLGLR